MNTASRMESTGVKRYIQVSEATADCLRSAGKGSWLRLREELVEVKGKGQMQTYFLELRNAASSTVSCSGRESLLSSEAAPDDDVHDDPQVVSSKEQIQMFKETMNTLRSGC